MDTMPRPASRHRFHDLDRKIFRTTSGPVSEAGWLPEDLAADAARRLGLASLIYASTYFVAHFVSGFVGRFRPDPLAYILNDPSSYIAAAAIALAIAVFVVSVKKRNDPDFVLDVGLVFMVLGSAGIATGTIWGLMPGGPPDPDMGNDFMGVPWEATWILLYPMIAPNKPHKILVAALLSATTGLAVAFMSRFTGATPPSVSYGFLVQYFLFTSYICAFLAWFGSKCIYDLGSSVREAREIGSYELVEKLGAGGMGEVWRAKHRLLARPAAVKLIKPEMLGCCGDIGSEVQQRFELEAQTTAGLQSPHTVEVYDFGRTSRGAYYYVMELLDGLSFEELVKKHGPQPPERVVPLLRQICHSLHDAHASHLVHRDIKPGNIFVCRYGQEHDFVKVLDFGLVKQTQQSAQEDLNLTRVDSTYGTPGFLSPEMALGKADIDGRADLYSLGCVAYWLLTGEPVFRGETALEVAAMHLKDEPLPPSSLCEFPVPTALDEIILACLAKKPEDRPAGACDVARVLDAIDLPGRWDADRARRWWDVNAPVAV